MAPSAPRASVIVRSYRRPDQVAELVRRLAEQDHDSYEIVVVEQSEDRALRARLAAIAGDRLRLLRRPPLGAPGARNEGVRHARGEILLFIDDDDLPIGRRWIADHVANYDDPACVGVNGRLTSNPDGPRPTRFPRLVRWASFHYSLFRDNRALAVGDLRKPGILFLVGNNFSVRRSLVDQIGGWDEGIPMGEEQSFCFKYELRRDPRQYFVYDPRPVIWRRVDIAGGLDRRTRRDWHVNELRGRVIFYHAVVGHYFPVRFVALYPLFVLRAAQQVLTWIWDHDNRGHGLAGRLRASLALLLWLLPVTWRDGIRRPRRAVRRVPVLMPAAEREGDGG
jgi:glycosyltransferase involved in cell wall biosynthesis